MLGVISWRNAGLGVLSWLLPFAASVPFFDSSGTLLVAQPLFKSLMVVIGGGIGVALLVVAFRRLVPGVASGLGIGLFWLALNLALDLAVLVPMNGMTVPAYLADIGLRYLLLPIVATGMGLVAGRGGSRQA
ncbi:MAG: hypothetical protein R3D33_15575 [Hyphomicrobiaceae bacterium]